MTHSQIHPLAHRLPEKHRGDMSMGDEGVISYRSLLDLAHQDGLRTIRTTLLQIPTVGNGETAIVQAVVMTKRGTFTGLADANPGNADAEVATHLVSLAETRAEARALRKAVNVGVVTQENLGRPLSDVITKPGDARGPSDAQRRYLFQLLAKQGLDGDLARDFVHYELGVESLNAAPRSSIYTLIDQLRRSHASQSSSSSDRRPS